MGENLQIDYNFVLGGGFDVTVRPVAGSQAESAATPDVRVIIRHDAPDEGVISALTDLLSVIADSGLGNIRQRSCGAKDEPMAWINKDAPDRVRYVAYVVMCRGCLVKALRRTYVEGEGPPELDALERRIKAKSERERGI